MSPRDLLDEVKRFARRRPVAFLALAAAAGVVAGRVTRGAVAANTSVDSDTEPTPARAYDSGDLTIAAPATPRTAPAATRTATTPRVTATPAYRDQVQAWTGGSTTPEATGAVPPGHAVPEHQRTALRIRT